MAEVKNYAQEFCLKSQVGLGQIIQKENGQGLFDYLPMLDVLTSSELGYTGSQPQFFQDEEGCLNREPLLGHNKSVYVTYTKPDCVNTAPDGNVDCTVLDSLNLCNAPASDHEVVCERFDIDNCYYFQVAYTTKQLREKCKNPESFIQEDLERNFRFHRQYLEKYLTAEVLMLRGKTVLTPDGLTTDQAYQLPLMNQNGTPNSNGWMEMQDHMTWAGLQGCKPIIIGDGLWRKYMRDQNVYCCNQHGVDLSRANQGEQYTWFENAMLDRKLGTKNNALVVVPGYLRLLTRNKNIGAYAEQFDNQQYNGTYTDQYGLTWDVYVRVVNCGINTKYIFTYVLNWGLWSMPTNATCNHNGIFHYQMACTNGRVCNLPQKCDSVNPTVVGIAA